MMETYQRQFIKFAIAQKVLQFGEFTLKSGRKSPYFFNAGLFHSGQSLARLGQVYAAAITRSALDFDLLLGPAYKGIPLVCASAMALYQQHQRDIPWCFNRKEAKDHGEGGTLVGAPLRGRVLIVDDVITAGTAIREVMAIVRAAGAEPAGVVVALDRQERGQDAWSAIQEVEREFGVPVLSVVSLAHIITYVSELAEQGAEDWRMHLIQIQAYRASYGIDS